MSSNVSVVLLCFHVQADGCFPGDATLCRHGSDAEVWLYEAPAALSGCAH